MNVSLILVDLDGPSAEWQTNIRLAIEATTRRLYVYFEGTQGVVFCMSHSRHKPHRRVGCAGKQAYAAPDVGLLALLARYYNEVADLRPQLDLIPLFPFAAWSLGQHDQPLLTHLKCSARC